MRCQIAMPKQRNCSKGFYSLSFESKISHIFITSLYHSSKAIKFVFSIVYIVVYFGKKIFQKLSKLPTFFSEFQASIRTEWWSQHPRVLPRSGLRCVAVSLADPILKTLIECSKRPWQRSRSTTSPSTDSPSKWKLPWQLHRPNTFLRPFPWALCRSFTSKLSKFHQDPSVHTRSMLLSSHAQLFPKL